jgi:hypothetical protein
MYSHCDVSSEKSQIAQSPSRRSIDGRRTHSLATRLLHFEARRRTQSMLLECRHWSLFRCQAHSCVEKAGLIAMVKVHQLPVDEHYSLRGVTLEQYIQADKDKGLIPFFVRRMSREIDEQGPSRVSLRVFTIGVRHVGHNIVLFIRSFRRTRLDLSTRTTLVSC